MKQIFNVIFFLLVVVQSFGQTTTTSGGDFSTSGNWDSGVPASGDDAVVNHDMSLSASIDINKGDWTINGSVTDVSGGTAYDLDINGNGADAGYLYVDGNVTIEGDLEVFGNGNLYIRTGDTLSIGGNATFNNGSIIQIDAGGVLIITGNLTNDNNSDAVIVNGVLEVGGTFYGNNGSAVSGSGSLVADDIDATGSGEVFGVSGNTADCTSMCAASNEGIGNVYYVSTSGNDGNSGSSWSNAKATLQDIFDDYDLDAGHRIYLSAGTFNESALFPGTDDEGFIVEGQGMYSTIVDAQDNDVVIKLTRDNHDDITIKNLTVKGGQSASTNGAGIRTGNNTQTGLQFSYVRFYDNVVTGSSYEGGGLFLGDNTIATITNCRFENNSAGGGGAICINSGSSSTADVTISNSTFSGNFGIATRYGGGAIFQGYKSTLTIDSCIFNNNYTPATTSSGYYGGGAIYSYSLSYDTYTNINQTIFRNNYASGTNSGGGAIGVYDNSIITIDSSLFESNYTTANTGFGGAIQSDGDARITATYTQFNKNASGRGGAIFSDGDSLNLTGCSFNLDSASYNGTTNSGIAGGAIQMYSGIGVFDSIVVDSCVTSASSNTYADGGGIAIETGTTTITRSTITYCRANDNGGGVSGVGGTVNLTNSVLAYNYSDDRGGAAYLGCTGNITNCTIYGNTSGDVRQESADGIETWNSQTVTISNSIIYGNGDNDVREGDGANGTINMSYSCYGSYTGGGTLSNNITSDPLFFDVSSLDFRILYSSSCRNAGTSTGVPSVDIYSVSRPYDTDYDIGAHENNCASSTTWDGNRSSSVENDQNWSDGIPCGGGVVFTSAGNTPVINSSTTLFANDLTINSGAVLNVTSTSSDAYLMVAGNLTVNGTLNHTGSTPVRLTGSGKTITVGGSASMGNAKFDVKSGASYTLNNDASISDLTTESNASFTVSASNTFSLGDDLVNVGTTVLNASSTLDIADAVTNSGTITSGASVVINIGGDYSNTGTFTSSTETVTLDGSSLQTLSAGFSVIGQSSTLLDEDFENSGSRPTGWTESYVSGTVDWEYGDGGRSDNYPSGANGGSYNARFYEDAFSNSSSYLISPELDFSTYNVEPTLTFYLAQVAWGSDVDSIGVYYKTSSGGTWVHLQTFSAEVASWTQQSISLPNVNSTYYIGFKGNSTYGRGGCIDDVQVAAKLGSGVGTPVNEFYNLTLNNSAGFSLSDDLGIDNILTMTEGVVSTGSSDTVIVANTSGSSITGFSDQSFVNGNLIHWVASNTDTYKFPLGKGTASNAYYLIELTNNSLTGVDLLKAKFTNGYPSSYTQSGFEGEGLAVSTGGNVTGFTLDELSSDGYFNIDPNVQPSGGDYSLKIYTSNYDKTSWQNNKVVIAKRPTGSTNSSDWTIAGTLPDDDAGGRSVNDGYLYLSALTSFSEFVPGGDFGAALPVELLSFDGVYNFETDEVELNWVTATEENNEYFQIEKTKDGVDYETVSKVAGYGSSIIEIEYDYLEEQPKEGLWYYRLKQVDFDGGFDYSDDIIIDVVKDEDAYAPFEVLNDGQNIIFKGPKGFSLSIYDVLGRKLNNVPVRSLGGGYYIKIEEGNSILFYHLQHPNKDDVSGKVLY